MDAEPIKLIQMSDLHLFKHEEMALLGVNTLQSLTHVLEMYKKSTNPVDFFILTGDLSQDGSKESYERVANLFYPLAAPVYFVPGNHDHLDQMTKVYPMKNIFSQRTVIVKQWQIILLNSQKEHDVVGQLSEDQFDFLHEALDTYPEHHALIVFHHHPIPTDSFWLDPLGLKNAHELWEFLKGYPQVRAVLFGHVHQAYAGRKNGIYYFSAPSTCFQFKPHSARFALDHLPQGYRWMHLYANGEIKTGIERLPEYIGEFNKDATGY